MVKIRSNRERRTRDARYDFPQFLLREKKYVCVWRGVGDTQRHQWPLPNLREPSHYWLESPPLWIP